MRSLWSFILLLSCFATISRAENVKAELPPLTVKPYTIGIAPSHITEPPAPLFESDRDWATVASQARLYKYYGVQLMRDPVVSWSTQLDPSALTGFAKSHEMSLGCEFGDFYLGPQGFQKAVNAAVKQLDPIFEAGGEVASIHLDGPFRRLIKGYQKQPGALSLEEISVGMVDFWKSLHAKYPKLQIGLITNFPNWDYTEERVGYNGDYTHESGVTYLQVIESLYTQLAKNSMKIDFIEIDCPYNYYRAKRTRNNDATVDNARKFKALQAWCEKRGIKLHLIVNAEPRDQGAKGFHDWTCQYIRQLRRDGIFPDVFIIQSWYKEPMKHLPETETNTFMNTARDAAALIRDSYPIVLNIE